MFMNDMKKIFPNITQYEMNDLINSGIDISKIINNASNDINSINIPNDINTTNVINQNTINEDMINNLSIGSNAAKINANGIYINNEQIMGIDYTGISNNNSPYLYYDKSKTENFDSVKNLYR
jgi:hypothetical protein